MKKIILLAAVAAATSAQGAVIWTGSTDSDYFNDANWDFSAAVNGTTEINPQTVVNEDLIIGSGFSVTASSPANFGEATIGDGFTLSLDNANLTFADNDGIAGNDDAGDLASFVTLSNGSSLSIGFAAVGIDITVDGTSSLTITDGGDGINSQLETTIVRLETGSMLTLADRAEFDDQVGNLVVNGVQVTAENLDDSFTFNGATGTASAIPEPSSTALLGLAGLGLMIRRRR